jgi:hypothetical protein
VLAPSTWWAAKLAQAARTPTSTSIANGALPLVEVIEVGPVIWCPVMERHYMHISAAPKRAEQLLHSMATSRPLSSQPISGDSSRIASGRRRRSIREVCTDECSPEFSPLEKIK